jgi:hypothetical protein
MTCEEFREYNLNIKDPLVVNLEIRKQCQEHYSGCMDCRGWIFDELERDIEKYKSDNEVTSEYV